VCLIMTKGKEEKIMQLRVEDLTDEEVMGLPLCFVCGLKKNKKRTFHRVVEVAAKVHCVCPNCLTRVFLDEQSRILFCDTCAYRCPLPGNRCCQ